MNEEVLIKSIEKRAKKKRLSSSIEKLKYASRLFFLPMGENKFNKVLFVGVGHGHDALLALAENKAEVVVGVDPYIAEDGNDNEDYDELVALIDELDLTHRFILHKETIQGFLERNTDVYDLIVIPDVLHHIFVTCESLAQSQLFHEAKALFRQLRMISATPDSVLAISEAYRFGLRPWLSKKGFIAGHIDYFTKQSPDQWGHAAASGGWQCIESRVYVPFALRKLSWLLRRSVLRWVFATRYFSYYKGSPLPLRRP